MTVLVVQYFALAPQEHEAFELSNTHIKYHSNWTEENGQLHHIQQLQDAYKIQTIK